MICLICQEEEDDMNLKIVDIDGCQCTCKYHQMCLDEWYLENGQRCCPICKITDTVEDALEPIEHIEAKYRQEFKFMARLIKILISIVIMIDFKVKYGYFKSWSSDYLGFCWLFMRMFGVSVAFDAVGGLFGFFV